MPFDTPYASCDCIIIRFHDSYAVADRGVWSDSVVALLDLIRAIPLGRELMDEIKGTKHTLFLQPAVAQSNQCAAANHNCYVRLRQAYESFGSFDFRTELKSTLDRAARSQISLGGIARRIMGGMGGATVQTSRNVAPPSGDRVTYEKRKTDKTGKVVTDKKTSAPVWIDAKLTEDSLLELLQGLLDGSRKKMELQIRRNGRSLSEDLFRCFYIPNATVADEYMQRGSGCNATISFNPAVTASCWLDEHITRPPAIGLAHEMIHALRNMQGLRVFKDKEKLADAPTPDDEVMTTGFPPYQWEKFTENMFRTLWAINDIGAIDAPGTELHGKQPLRHKY